MNAKEAAEKVLAKLESSTLAKPMLAVFRKGDDIQMIKPTTDLFCIAINKRLHDFAGVYDIGAKAEWIEEDLIYCGMAAG